jgi:ADP-heptose:LPS heptosyltransferase
LELVRPVVGDASFRRFHLPVPANAEAETRCFLANSGITGPFAVINPGGSWPSKRWEKDRFANVAQQLHTEPGIPTVVTWAGDDERSMADEIVRLARGAAIKAPPTSLPDLAALVKQAAVFVGCDTGPLHMAAAVGTVCVGLHGPTRPEDSGAYGSIHTAVQARYQSGSCRQRRRGPNDAMREITVSMVVDAARKALQRAKKKSVDRHAA